MTTSAEVDSRPALLAEFDRQIETLIERDHPDAPGLQPDELRDRLSGLGDVWTGNPHTWLGTASCSGRARMPIPGG